MYTLFTSVQAGLAILEKYDTTGHISAADGIIIATPYVDTESMPAEEIYLLKDMGWFVEGGKEGYWCIHVIA